MMCPASVVFVCCKNPEKSWHVMQRARVFGCAMTREKNGHHRHSLGVSAPRRVNTDDACTRFAVGLIVLAASCLLLDVSPTFALHRHSLTSCVFRFREILADVFFCLQTATRLSDGDAMFLLWSRLLADFGCRLVTTAAERYEGQTDRHNYRYVHQSNKSPNDAGRRRRRPPILPFVHLHVVIFALP